MTDETPVLTIDIKKEESQLIQDVGLILVKQELLIPCEEELAHLKEADLSIPDEGSGIAPPMKKILFDRKRSAEKIYYASIKDDPVRWATQQGKEREKYKKKLEKGQRKLVANMSKGEWEYKKYNWKVSSKKYREKKKTRNKSSYLPGKVSLSKITPNLPTKSLSQPNPNQASKNNSKLYRENQKLKKQLISEKKKAANYRKQMLQLTGNLKNQTDQLQIH